MSKERAAQLVDAGVWLKLSGDLDGARRLFERALKLDPANEKAKQLLSQPAEAAPSEPPPPELPPPTNPFEREVSSSPSAVEKDWGLATSAPPASSPSSIEDDWGRMTGAQTPVPQPVPASAPAPASTPSQSGLPPPPAFSSSPSQATQQFAMPKEVRVATPVSAPSTRGTMLFALPDEVKAAAAEVAAPAKSSPSGTLAFAMPAEVKDAAPPVSSSPSSATMAFAMPDEVKAAMGQAPASTPSGTMAFAMPDEVKAAVGKAPASSPSGTMTFAVPGEVKAAQAPPVDDGDEFGKLADEAEEIPLDAVRPSRIAPLPRPLPRGSKPQPAPPAPRAPADTSPDDWGSLTDEPARAPSSDSFIVTTPSSAAMPPPAFESRPSQGTQQFAMPREVRQASPGTSSPSGTMQFAMPPDVAPASSSPSGTMQFALPKDVAAQAVPEPHPVPKTISLSGELPPSAPETIRLDGDAEPPAPPKATPPLFSMHDESSVTLNGDAPPPSPPSATPPMFSDAAPDPLGAFNPDLLPPPPGPSPVPTAPPEGAWQWKSSSPPPQAEPDEQRPVPRPSPNLDPAAQSAWDQRSNPGIKLEAVVGADRALDLLSSDSKITRDPAKAQRDEIATILRGARDLLDLDDHTGAMELIDKAEKLAPDSPEVRQLKERSERTLLAMFESKLGHLEKIPRVLLKDDEIIWLNLDHRAGFVLAQIDGMVTFDDLFAVSGMSRLDTARILAQLVDEGVISRG